MARACQVGVDIDAPKAFAPNTTEAVGVIICKQSIHQRDRNRGYIAMLSVSKEWRKMGIGEKPSLRPVIPLLNLMCLATTLIRRAMETMVREGAEEVRHAY